MFNYSHYKQIITFLEKSNVIGFYERFENDHLGSVRLMNSSLSSLKINNTLTILEITVFTNAVSVSFLDESGAKKTSEYNDFDSFFSFFKDLVELYDVMQKFNSKHKIFS